MTQEKGIRRSDADLILQILSGQREKFFEYMAERMAGFWIDQALIAYGAEPWDPAHGEVVPLLTMRLGRAIPAADHFIRAHLAIAQDIKTGMLRKMFAVTGTADWLIDFELVNSSRPPDLLRRAFLNEGISTDAIPSMRTGLRVGVQILDAFTQLCNCIGYSYGSHTNPRQHHDHDLFNAFQQWLEGKTKPQAELPADIMNLGASVHALGLAV